MIYFDNAATSFPKPKSVHKAVHQALVRYGANPGRSGHALSIATAREVYEVRARVADFFGAPNPEQVVFTQNCTHALNTAIYGLLRQGDHVIISDIEHNSVLRPVHALAQRGVIAYSVAQVDTDEEKTVHAFAELMRPETRAIITTHASNVFGIKVPVQRLAKLAHAQGAYIIVDAAQSAGTEPIDVRAWQIDFLCAAGHKSLYGPSGTGLLVACEDVLLEPLMQGGTGSLSQNPFQPEFMPDRLEAGTVNTMGIIGLGAGIAFIQKYGRDRLSRQKTDVARMLYDGLSNIPGVLLYTPAPQHGVNLPVVSFNIEGVRAEDAAELLNQKGFALRGGLHCAPGAHQKMGTAETGTVRASIGAFNTPKQAKRLVRAVREAVADAYSKKGMEAVKKRLI